MRSTFQRRDWQEHVHVDVRNDDLPGTVGCAAKYFEPSRPFSFGCYEKKQHGALQFSGCDFISAANPEPARIPEPSSHRAVVNLVPVNWRADSHVVYVRGEHDNSFFSAGFASFQFGGPRLRNSVRSLRITAFACSEVARAKCGSGFRFFSNAAISAKVCPDP